MRDTLTIYVAARWRCVATTLSNWYAIYIQSTKKKRLADVKQVLVERFVLFFIVFI